MQVVPQQVNLSVDDCWCQRSFDFVVVKTNFSEVFFLDPRSWHFLLRDCDVPVITETSTDDGIGPLSLRYEVACSLGRLEGYDLSDLLLDVRVVFLKNKTNKLFGGAEIVCSLRQSRFSLQGRV